MLNSNLNPKTDQNENKSILAVFNIEKKKGNKQLKWTKEEDSKLLSLVENYGAKIVWSEISKHFDNKSKTQCYSRFRQINPTLNKGAWTEKEEKQLSELTRKYGKNWAKISVMLKTRSGKQIRDHYNYCLDNKGNFTEEEDLKIKNLYLKLGNKFSKFSEFIPGRTGESIKNRFHSSIKRKYNLLSTNIIKQNCTLNNSFDNILANQINHNNLNNSSCNIIQDSNKKYDNQYNNQYNNQNINNSSNQYNNQYNHNIINQYNNQYNNLNNSAITNMPDINQLVNRNSNTNIKLNGEQFTENLANNLSFDADKKCKFNLNLYLFIYLYLYLFSWYCYFKLYR